MVNLLAGEGKNVKVLAESTQEGVKSADFLIDGVKTELKTISNISSPKLSNAIKKRIVSGAKQSGNLIIDVTGQKGANKDVINEALVSKALLAPDIACLYLKSVCQENIDLFVIFGFKI